MPRGEIAPGRRGGRAQRGIVREPAEGYRFGGIGEQRRKDPRNNREGRRGEKRRGTGREDDMKREMGEADSGNLAMRSVVDEVQQDSTVMVIHINTDENRYGHGVYDALRLHPHRTPCRHNSCGAPHPPGGLVHKSTRNSAGLFRHGLCFIAFPTNRRSRLGRTTTYPSPLSSLQTPDSRPQSPVFRLQSPPDGGYMPQQLWPPHEPGLPTGHQTHGLNSHDVQCSPHPRMKATAPKSGTRTIGPSPKGSSRTNGRTGTRMGRWGTETLFDAVLPTAWRGPGSTSYDHDRVDTLNAPGGAGSEPEAIQHEEAQAGK
ncbi:uncharacterized protein N7482_004888 [Penicillium canariense]|uniref:Uncharacterized protein n=1 Tax=Penicillium canariense TaxID=189055 RepID=A0A9W9LM32_9EURO|nr:uncharacterized protein N7482_004888 [Penicillium canariense]KAJ5166107.1 hypothetical protein N7482_004888 [Penicillium canariense]